MASSDTRAKDRQELDAIVDEVVAEAHLSRSLLLPEEIDYIREHALKKPLRVIHIWALGVGVVITGEYFGWNFGLPVGGPLGVLLASLIVCVLYLTWVLTLSELSVMMPFAGGPMAYGRRAVGKWLGFLMGWSMLLECLFATIGTALATGGYYLERAAALPEIVGAHYFQMIDQPVSGRFDGENYNLGFLNQLDIPYPEMVSFARAAHRRMYPVHAGAVEPAPRQARVR